MIGRFVNTYGLDYVRADVRIINNNNKKIRVVKNAVDKLKGAWKDNERNTHTHSTAVRGMTS